MAIFNAAFFFGDIFLRQTHLSLVIFAFSDFFFEHLSGKIDICDEQDRNADLGFCLDIVG